jgi:hypothetical protein
MRSYLGNWSADGRHATISWGVRPMRKICLIAGLAVLCGTGAQAQQPAAVPQTARQALIEMFFGKTPGTLAKHLPAVTVAALEKSGALNNAPQFSQLMTQFQGMGNNFQTFETGSVLMVAETPKTDQKVEITVENDALHGDQDDLDLKFHVYKSGQEQMSPFMPQLTFSMKQEAQIWKLNEISVTIHMPLTDPEFLKTISQKMAAPMAQAPPVSRSEAAVSTAGSDAQVLAAMRTILTAEVTYFSAYPTVGFTCSLSDLDGFGGGQPNEHQAMLINSGLASGKRYGYVFSLSGCSGAPANSFHLTAVPSANLYGRKAFCSDQSALIRSSSDANPALCQSGGSPVQ